MTEYFRTTPEQRVPYIRELIQRYKESGDILGEEVLKYKDAYEVFQANKGSTAEERDEAFLAALKVVKEFFNKYSEKNKKREFTRDQLQRILESNPQEYHDLWTALGDESRNLSQRLMEYYKKRKFLIQGENQLIEENKLVSFYLFCMNPSHYPVIAEQFFLFTLAPQLAYTLKKDSGKSENLLWEYFALSEEIRGLLIEDKALINRAAEKLGILKDDSLIIDMIIMDLKIFCKSNPIFMPRDVYDPRISKEMWVDFWLRKMSLEEKKLLKSILAAKGELTLKEIASKKDLPVLKNNLSSLQEKLKETTGYPPYYFDYNTCSYIGTHIGVNTPFSKIRLRPELKEALEELKIMEDDTIPLYEPGKEKKAEEEKGDPDTMTERNIILYGPPGTGKTYHTINYALHLIEDKELKKLEEEDREALQERFQNLREKGQVSFTTFHQSYGYEEFIEGIKPVMMEEVESKGNEDDGKDVGYRIEQGLFQRFCREAEKNPEENYVFIIDEINRGNISKIFGELITLIENSKRLGGPEEARATLPYSGKEFGVPQNVFLLGTMNTADRSIALLDTALRRRFRFVEMMPDPSILDGIAVDGVNIRGLLKVLNERIELLYDREHTIGHAYFTPLREDPSLDALEGIFKDRIFPLLQEYFYEDYGKIRAVLGDGGKEDKEHQFIKRVEKNWSDLFPDVEGESYESRDSFSYEVNHKAFSLIESYRGIYGK